MLFPTIDFAIFFVIVFTGSWMLRPYAKTWRWFLLVASCIFYLDPFNPVATEGRDVFHLNLPIAAAILGVGFATAGILKAAFGSVGGPTAIAGGHRQAGLGGVGDVHDDGDQDSFSGAAAERDGADDIGSVATLTRPPLNPASIWAPIVVGAMLLVGNTIIGQAFPERADQSWRFLFLLIGVALINQTFAQATFASLGPTRERTTQSRRTVWAAVATNLAVLGLFKYLNWFSDIFAVMVEKLGVNMPLSIILPIAISFFIFQAISYVIDVGRGELRPIPLLDFTVYLAFFAHVVAGPIVHVKEFAPQLDAKADPRFVQSAEAFELIFRGLFKKVVISSFLAAQIVDPVFASPTSHGKFEVLVGVVGYAVQIYCDFSGYTDIAIGVALLLGIRFPQNFDAPYRALSLQDFWRRWHMTLSRWLRDYLYIPLGGNRLGYSRTYVNLFLTMVIGGLWHGANWTFLVWGAIHGFGLGAERWIKEKYALRSPIGLPAPLVKTLQWFVTFTVVCLAWIFFRAQSVGAAFEIIKQLFVGQSLPGAKDLATPTVIGVILVMLASQFVPERIPQRLTVIFSRTPPVIQVACGVAGLVLINVLGPELVAPFIYFQF